MLNVICGIIFLVTVYYQLNKYVSRKAANIYGIITFTLHLIEVLCTTDWTWYPIIGLIVLSVALFNKYWNIGFFGLITYCSCPIVVRCFLL